MNFNARSMKLATGLLSVLMTGCLLASCSQTSSPAPSQAAQAAAIQAAPPPPMASVQPAQPGAAGGRYEEPPVVNVADLLPATPLSGPGYTVQPQAPTNGAMGQYTIVADPSMFHDDAGTYYVESLDMLKIRLSEIPAIAALDNRAGKYRADFRNCREKLPRRTKEIPLTTETKCQHKEDHRNGSLEK
jgi:hypothetical protein